MAKKKASKKPAPVVPPKRKGLKVKPIPDLASKLDMREKLEIPAPKISLSNHDHVGINHAIVPDGLTDEQRAIKEAGRFAQKMLDEEDIGAAIKSMVTFRRGYAIVYRAYQEMLERKRSLAEEKGDYFDPMVEDFLVQYAMYEASKPFNEHQFMQGMIGTVMPFMADVIDRHTKEEEITASEERIAADDHRRKRRVPIGFHHTHLEEEPYLEKDRSLVLVGWKNALLWIVDHTVNHVLTAMRGNDDGGPFMVIRFMNEAPKSKEQQRYLIRLPGNAWRGCADSQKKMAQCMGQYVADKLSAQPDLLVFDDLSHAYTQGFVGRPSAASAGDAQRNIRRWADNAGCAVMGLVPFDGMEPPDVTEPVWEQLRTFTNLRPVTVELVEDSETGEQTYKLVVGNNAAIFTVKKETLDAYDRGKILLPAGVELEP